MDQLLPDNDLFNVLQILLPTVYPDSTLVFTILDQTSLGRHNFLAQASVQLTPRLANVTTAMIDSFKKQAKTAQALSATPMAAPPVSSAPKGGLFGRSASTASTLPPPPRSSTNSVGFRGAPSRTSVDGMNSSTHFKTQRPPNQLELSLGEQLQVRLFIIAHYHKILLLCSLSSLPPSLQDIWFEGCTEQSSLSPRTMNMGLSTSEHGAPRSMAVPPYWSSSPEIFTKLRQWDFGTCHASFNWCPMHASK